MEESGEETDEQTGLCEMKQDKPQDGLQWLLQAEGRNQGTVWGSKEIRILSCKIPLMSLELWIWGKRKADGRCVRFANGCDGSGSTRIGELSRTR